MAAHVAAEFVHDDAGRLLRVNEPHGGPAPRFFVGRTPDGDVVRFRHDVDDATCRALLAAVADEGPLSNDALTTSRDTSQFEAILARSAPIQQTWTGPAFSFSSAIAEPEGVVRVTAGNAHLLRPWLEPWLPDVETAQPMFAVLANERAVAVCCSVRQTSIAHEAGVETAPEHRGRGYAVRAVAAWGRAVREMGRVPLYSTSWHNEASRGVARRLGLVLVGIDVHVT